jgi:cephalosporin-C deacetylase-like acetyl esterase
VLIPVGHTQEGKPEEQVLAANLAKKGYVVLTYDPIGQGEREQTYLTQLGRALSGGGGNEHLELGARSILIGQSVARYFINDAKRGLDYLASRSDVDADRLGVTGCSGGGCITTYIAALDPRVKAAAPGCYIQTFRKLFTGPTADSEMSLPQFLANGFDLADLIELPAPLPWLLLATTEDYFNPEGARPVYEEARKFYGLYDAADRVQFSVAPGPHGTPKESREAIYGFLSKWLKDGRGDTTDTPVHQYTNLELRVTPTGAVGGYKLWQIIQQEAHSRVENRSLDELRKQLREVLTDKSTPQIRKDGDRLRFESEPGVEISAKLHLPAQKGKHPAVIVVEEKRLRVPLYVQLSQSTAAICEALTKAGNIVLELDVRDSPDANEGRPFLGNWVTNERADLIGRNLPIMRAHDVLRGVDLLASLPEVDASQIRAYARGVKGYWLLMAASMDPRLKGIWLDRTPVSIRSALDEPLTNNLFDVLIPSFARHWDFTDLAQGLQVFWTDPTNWMNRVINAGPQYRYRYVGEADSDLIHEFLR